SLVGFASCLRSPLRRELVNDTSTGAKRRGSLRDNELATRPRVELLPFWGCLDRALFFRPILDHLPWRKSTRGERHQRLSNGSSNIRTSEPLCRPWAVVLELGR